MFIKRLPIFLKVQLLLIAAVGAVLLVGDRSQPKVAKLPESVLVNQPIIITFDRPMRKETVEKGFRLAAGEAAVEGTFSWSSRSVAFTPGQPLAYGTSYALSLTGIEDKEGHVMRNPYEATLRTSAPRFVHMTPDFKLSLFNLETGRSVVLSAEGEKILDYAVSADGKLVVASFQDLRDERVSGLYSLRLEEAGSGEKTMLYRGMASLYGTVELCGSGSLAVVSRDDIDEKGLLTKSALVSFPLTARGFDFGRQSTFLSSDEAPSPGSLVCSHASDQIMYQGKAGSVMLGSLTEPAGDPLGNYQFAYGFSPAGSTAILGDTTSAELPTNRVVYAIDAQGLRELISDHEADSAYPAYDPQERILAVSEDVPEVGNPDEFRTHFKLVLRQRDKGAVHVRAITDGSGDSSDERPTWSADGRLLSFERVPRDLGLGLERPRSSDGSLIDGRLWLAELRPGSNVLSREIEVRPLEISGSKVSWLP